MPQDPVDGQYVTVEGYASNKMYFSLMEDKTSEQQFSMVPRPSMASTFYVLGSIALVTSGLIYFDSIFKPFVVALLVWFIIYQIKLITDKITIRGVRIPSLVSSILSSTVIMATLFVFVELIIWNVQEIAASIPGYMENFNVSVDDLEAVVNNPQILEYLQAWVNEIDLSNQFQLLANSFSDGIANLGIVIMYVIFFLIERATYSAKLSMLFPEESDAYYKFYSNMNRIGNSVRSYVWSKTMISVMTGAISWVILLVMGVDHAFLWAVLIFLLNFIPYIGPLISSLLPALYAGLVMGDPMMIIYVFLAMELVQVVLGTFIEPKVMGKGSNLSPVTVLVALAFWGLIWGASGMILAIPVTSLIVIVCSQIPSTRYVAILLSEKGEIPDIE